MKDLIINTFNATVAFVTPLGNTALEVGKEVGKTLVYTTEATAGATLQAATALRMGAEVCSSMAPKTVEEAEKNLLNFLESVTPDNTTDTEKSDKVVVTTIS